MSAVLPGTCYIETPKQRLYAEAVVSGRYRELYFGGAIRSGKSMCVMAILFLLCKVFPGSRWAIVRKDLPTLRRNILPVFAKMRLFTGAFMGPVLHDTWTATATNGSQILLLSESLDTDPEYNRWRGLEANGFWLEEANELDERSYNKAKERAGSWIIPGLAKQPLPYIFLTSNPAGNWVKRLFYTPWKNDQLKPYQFYIPAGPHDNPYNTKEYLESLEGLNERDYKIFVLGDWDELSGSALEELDPRVHIIEPFRIPDHWIRFGAFDWGFAHPFVFGLYAANEEGYLYKADTISSRRMQDAEMIDYIIEASSGQGAERWLGVNALGLSYTVAGHDAWHDVQARTASGPTTADRFAAAGLPMIKADVSRIAGLKNFREMTSWRRATVTETKTRGGLIKTYGPGTPKLRWFDTPGNRASFQNTADMILDPERPEDVLKVNAGEDGKGGDDWYDECVVGDTLVETCAGPQRIDALVGTSGLLPSLGGVRRFFGVRQTQARAEIVRVLLDDGRSVDLTRNHRVLTAYRGWVRVDDLLLGDRWIDIHGDRFDIDGALCYIARHGPGHSQRHGAGVSGAAVLADEGRVLSAQREVAASGGVDGCTRADSAGPRRSPSGREPSEQSAWESQADREIHASARALVAGETGRSGRADAGEGPVAPSTGRGGAPVARGPGDALGHREGDVGERSDTDAALSAVRQAVQHEDSEQRDEVLSPELQGEGAPRPPRVTALILVGRAPVYNMEVEVDHCYAVAGGLVVHNCRYAVQSRVVAPQPPPGEVGDDRHPGIDWKGRKLRPRKRNVDDHQDDDDLHPGRYRVPTAGVSFGGEGGWSTPRWGSNGGEDDE